MKKILLVLMLVLLPSTLLAKEEDSPKKETPEETYEQLNLFGDVFEHIRKNYVREVTDKELIEQAINGMLGSLDPHSSFLNIDNFKDMKVQTKGEFGGLGIEITMDNGLIKIIAPIDDTPAARAGLQTGYYITHLDKQPIMGLTLSEAVDKMRGPIGTDILLTVRKALDGDPFEVTITRDKIKIKSVRHRIEGKIGYIRITTFNQQVKTGLEKAVEKIKEELGDTLIGYVLDLRNNPGGLLDKAIFVSDSFLEQGEIVSTRGRREEESKRTNAKPGDLAENLPIIVLINGGSASASEIVAGALQDHGRAMILGTRSFGKGSVQTIIPLSGGQNAMRLTTAHYYTPSGRSIQNTGIEPDIEVKQALIEELDLSSYRYRESDLRHSLDNPNGDKAPKDKKKSKKEKDAKKDEKGKKEEEANNKEVIDYQLIRALDLLRGIALFQQKVSNE